MPKRLKDIVPPRRGEAPRPADQPPLPGLEQAVYVSDEERRILARLGGLAVWGEELARRARFHQSCLADLERQNSGVIYERQCAAVKLSAIRTLASYETEEQVDG
jgi:hypothetical protein